MFEAFLAPISQSVIADPAVEDIQTVPDGARRMISAVLRMDDPDKLETVITAAKLAFPDRHSAIDALVVDLQKPTEPLTVDAYVVVGVPPEPPKYSYLENLEGRLDVNATYTEGNTETVNLGTRFSGSVKVKANIHRVEAYANLASANQARTQENWGASYQLDTLWTDDIFGYVRGSLEHDEFIGFESRTFVGAGAGYYFANTDQWSLRGEAGPGYRFSKRDNNGNEAHDWVLYGAVETKWTLNEDWILGHNSKVTVSEPSTSVVSRSDLSTSLTDALRAGLTHEVLFEENPPSDKENLDTILKFNLSYGF